MEINIRKSIKENFKGAEQEEIKTSITEAIASNDEVTLPGLGVFFETLWQNCNEDQQSFILTTLETGLK